MRNFTLTVIFGLFMIPSIASAYTPLIDSTTFDGVNADVQMVATGIISLFMIIVAVGLIIRGLMGR